ncbi:MAG TPA: PAS domain-containing protein [Candidatus Obscuribacterales bacterium]
MVRDITERKQAEEALNQAKAKYRSIFENAVEGIFQTSTDGQYLTANPMLATIYGYDSPEELIATLTDIQHQLYLISPPLAATVATDFLRNYCLQSSPVLVSQDRLAAQVEAI